MEGIQRALSSIVQVLLCLLPLVAICAVLQVELYLGMAFLEGQYIAVFLGFALAAVYLSARTRKRSAVRVPWYDVTLSGMSLIVFGYAAIFYPNILMTISSITPFRLIFSFIAIVLVLEGVRRTVGWTIIILVLMFLLYARFTHYFPGPLYGVGFSWERLLVFLYLDSTALLGIALKVVVFTVSSFILFGVILFNTGGGQFLTDLALSLMGRYRGGPAKVAVIASAFFGMMSGSAVANVATTGIITIPMMKRAGFMPHFAGAVEAVASTGGVIMPPVMGAVAFLMAEFLDTSYSNVVMAAIIPSFLYYLGVYMGVHFEAVTTGVRSIPAENLPSLVRTLKNGWLFIVPVAVLIYVLFVMYLEAGEAGLVATASLLVVTIVRSKTRQSLKALLRTLAITGRTLLELTTISAAIGFVIGAVGITGIGVSFSQMLIHASGNNLVVLLVFAAVGSIIMGMSMPITATYILMVVLTAPALIRFGIDPLIAHLFVLFFGNLSFLTPPVCLAVYAASTISNASPMRTAVSAVRLGISAYIVPFMFVFYPAIALQVPIHQAVMPVFTAAIGVSVIQGVMSGYLFMKLSVVVRILLLPAALGLLIPGWYTDGVSFIVLGGLLFAQAKANRSKVARVSQS